MAQWVAARQWAVTNCAGVELVAVEKEEKGRRSMLGKGHFQRPAGLDDNVIYRPIRLCAAELPFRSHCPEQSFLGTTIVDVEPGYRTMEVAFVTGT
jgi:hypothetical protein